MLLLSALSFAQAGEIMGDYASNPQISMLLECTPQGGLLSEQSAAAMEQALGSRLEAEQMQWLRLLDPQQASAAGINLEGALFVGMAIKRDDVFFSATPEGGVDSGVHVLVSTTFSGTPQQAQELLSTFSDKVQPSAEGWELGLGPVTQAQLSDGQLVLRTKDWAIAPGQGDVPKVLARLPEGAGCDAFVRLGYGERAEGTLGMHTAFLDPRHGQLDLRVEMLKKPPPASFRRAHKPEGGSSEEAPKLVLTVGVPLLDLAQLLPAGGRMQPVKDELAALKFTIKPGATIALFGDDDDMQLAAVMRVGGRLGLPHRGKVVINTMEDTLAGTPATITRVDRRTLKIGGPGGALGDNFFVHARRGRLYVAMDEQALEVLVSKSGQPWLSQEQAHFAGDWAIGLAWQAEALGSGNLGLGADGELWAMTLRTELPEGFDPQSALTKGPLAGLSNVLDHRMDELFNEVGEAIEQSAMSEVESNLSGLCIANLAYDAAFDQFVAAEPHPRAPDAVDAQALPWAPAPTAWTTLGWTPERELLKGSYWVEVLPDGAGVVAHGVSDEDGDGVRMHFISSSQGGCKVEEVAP